MFFPHSKQSDDTSGKGETSHGFGHALRNVPRFLDAEEEILEGVRLSGTQYKVLRKSEEMQHDRAMTRIRSLSSR